MRWVLALLGWGTRLLRNILMLMQITGTRLLTGLGLCGALIYGGYSYRNHLKIQQYLDQKSAIAVHPKILEGDASDIGYIYSMRRDTPIHDDELNLVWFVVVPKTNAHYSCSYEEGFPHFRVGDSVTLIHTTSDEADDGYIVGLHDQERGKTTMVWNFNMDNDPPDLENAPGADE
jgi:hypothetical protein